MENNLERPNYYGILPADVRYDPDISSSAKVLFAEITALCNMKGVCWATNKYFSELYGVQPTRISVWVKQLETKGFVSTKTTSQGFRGIYLSKDPYAKAEGGVLEKQKHNNQKNNSTYVKLEKDLLALANKVLNREFRVLPERGVKKTLDAFSLVEIEMALTALARDKWHISKLKELKLEYFIRSTTIDKFLAIAKKDGVVAADEGVEDLIVKAAGDAFPARWSKGKPEWSEDDDENRYFRGVKIDHTNQGEIMKIEEARRGA